MDAWIPDRLARLRPSLVLSLPLLCLACSRKPSSVSELFPDLTFDERARSKQFAVVASGSHPMIDDLEDSDLNGLMADGRNWSWSQFDDMTDGIQYLTIQQETEGPRQGSNVLYIKGGGWKKSGAGVSANLVYRTAPRGFGYYDASVFSGIEFWAKGEGLNRLVVSIGSPETTHSYDGGICADNPPGHFQYQAPLSSTWSQIRIPFPEFILSHGRRELPLDPGKIKGIHFGFASGGDYEIWIDEFAFYH